MDKHLKPDISLIDPAFSKTEAPRCILVVDLSWDHVAAGVYDPERGLWVAFEAWPSGKTYLTGHLVEHFIKVSETAALLKYAYAKTVILWGGTSYTLVPLALYQEAGQEQYLRFSQNLPSGEVIMTDTLRNIEAVNVFSMPLVVKESITQLFPGAVIRHAVSNLAESLLIRYKNSLPAQHLILNVGARGFEMIVLRENKLAFCNSFSYQSAEDLVYYVMFVMEQLKIEPQQSTLLIAGQLMKPSAVDDVLNTYFGKVSFISRNTQWKYSFVFDDLPGHMYYNLLNAMSCE